MTQVSNTVRFVLDGHIVEAQGERRTTTVLDYLREQLQRTGTKEGCAEGDCGACVVMVGELNAAGNGVDYVPVNSCIQLLPTLDGKSLKTIESLKKADGRLHPVQDEMIKCHGSQCGFCTPGIVMSLVNLVHVLPSPSRQQITDALSGNLCRCTGYTPIIDAAFQAVEKKSELKLDDHADVALLKDIQRAKTPTLTLDGDILVQPVVRTKKGNEFVSPATLAEVADYLLKNPTTTLLAGSTEIGLQVNKKFSRPERIMYLGNVAELRQVTETAQAWRMGAAVSLTQVETLIAKAYPDFAEVLRRFGSPPIRSTATLAGNIANGSPIGDSMPCLMALGASLVLRRGAKTRKVLLENFYTGMKKNVLEAGEFIEAVELPKPVTGQVFRAHKVSKRFEQDISATCAAISYSLQGGKLSGVKLAYNGLAPSPCRAPKLEAVLEGKTPAAVKAADLDAAITASFTARDGLRATWAYRALVARNLVIDFIEEQKEVA
ncbi:xanthine dehydrogenase small subunit [Limnohabitans sp. Rim8]|uniref:xanthine dehydrogenase small subunit n=1 Tax=Limnohabitans sp. Rim8 TaxID=1100718 RepID=UPI00261CB485|nr:xanthine dehydrogenase small subunit [Limnohabitans sp. Rim8]